MRLWGRGGEPPETDDDLLPEDEPGEAEVELTLDDLDEESRERAEAWAAKAVAAEAEKRETMLAQVREKGFDLTEAGMSLRDVPTAAAWLGAGQQEAGGARVATASAEPNGPPDADSGPAPTAPNQWEDPDGYARWIVQSTLAAARADYEGQIKAQQAEIAGLKGLVFGRETSEAVERVVERIREDPLWGRFAGHPDFAAGMEGALQGATPEQLKNPVWLKQAAAWVAGGLDESKLPAETPARGQDGRFMATQGRVLGDVQRQSLAQNAPSRSGGGRAEEGLALSREQARVFDILNNHIRATGRPALTERELAAAEHTTYDDWKQAMDRQPARR